MKSLNHIGIDYSTGEDFSVIHLFSGQPCSHPGCRNHISHPCEVCGRVSAFGEAFIKLVKEKK